MEEILERRAVISGIGQSDVGRRLNRTDLDLTIDAALEAIADAGLTRDDIDGIASYPGGGLALPAGFAGPSTTEVHDALRLKVGWYAAGLEGPAQLAPVINACMAVANGLASHVLVYRTVTEATAQGSGGRQGMGMNAPDRRAKGFMQWHLPFHNYSAANWTAFYAQRHMHEFGTTREQLGAIAVNNRQNAGRNPKAIFREPMTMEDYLGARTISTPLCLFDCDVPCDGSTAVIVSRAEHVTGTSHPVARVQAVGSAMRGRPWWDQFEDLTTMALRDAAAQLWTRTDMKPSDVDVAELYDGFSFITLAWLEALGFCKKGEGGPFVEGGARIALDGDVPLNTSGGQLSAGRLHGFGLLHEACVQLRGEGGDRQVRDPEVAVVAAGGGPIAGCMLLTREG
ncbi:MAG: thiolase family protein [Actinomycetota bacterium]